MLTDEQLGALLERIPKLCLRLALLPDGTPLTRERYRLYADPRPSRILALALAAVGMACDGAELPPSATLAVHEEESAEVEALVACTTPVPPEKIAKIAGTAELTPEIIEALSQLGYVE